MTTPIAALFVAKDGCYFNLSGIDPWDMERDARHYAGPYPVVAHPPCQRWGRFWHGSTRKPHQFKLGDDNGCFASALASVRQWGGVLEHPEGSRAWRHFGLAPPPRSGGWVVADDVGGWTCCVEQGHYGHFARKATWLYANGVELPDLRWGQGEQRIHPVALAKHGYEKARRIGMMAMVGGKNKTQIREATPIEFRDVLIGMASKKTSKLRTTRLSEKPTDCSMRAASVSDTPEPQPTERPKMTKVFRGSVTVEFPADAVGNKHELAGSVEKLLRAGVPQFQGLSASIKVDVTADYVHVRGPKAAKTTQGDSAQTDLGAAVAAAGGDPGGPKAAADAQAGASA